ncbi:MAG TPA: hypothetical protein PK536_11810 [Ignavibacteria bacterium]|nr:hypothetical protein [Bacteroidota bacterium]HRI86120.1 hypothetical protein [Ignavibacteria bacterium]HRK00450.1 hypothetical protein [Ignavibacteria bacterium]
MRKLETLQLKSLYKNKNFYTGEVIIFFNAVKCMYGDNIEFKQKNIPKELERFVGKDISKWKSRIYVNCIIDKYDIVTSTVTDGGEEYEVPTGISSYSTLKIISFDSLRYIKEFKI